MELSDIDEKALVKAIRAVLEKDDQVLIIPVRNGMRIFQIRRRELNMSACHKWLTGTVERD